MLRRPAARSLLLLLCAALAASTLIRAQEHVPAAPLSRADWPEAIEDNSFLIEEAYNQEPGVVQYIFNYARTRPDGAWLFTFTNEWPVPDENNQLSYQVGAGRSDSGSPSTCWDTFLNYRRQVLWEERDGWAFAPRVSVILPTGDWRKGMGNGVVGWQVGLPFTRRISRFFTVNFNLGGTLYPNAKSLTDSGRTVRNTLKTWYQGASVIWLTTSRLNLFLEVVASQMDQPDGSGRVERQDQALANPGFRLAFNLPKGQLVVGASVMLGLTPASPHSGIFLYCSWEAPAWKPKMKK